MNMFRYFLLALFTVSLMVFSGTIGCYKGSNIPGNNPTDLINAQAGGASNPIQSENKTPEDTVKEISNKIIDQTITIGQLLQYKEELLKLKATVSSPELLKEIENLIKQIDLIIAQLQAKQSAESAVLQLGKDAADLLNSISNYQPDYSSLEATQNAIDQYNIFLASLKIKEDQINNLKAQLAGNPENSDLIKKLDEIYAKLQEKEKLLLNMLGEAETKKQHYLSSLPCQDPGLQNFGSDFQSYLNQSSNSDLTGFGGSNTKTGNCSIVHQPVILIHGNADNADGSALPTGSNGAPYGGWKATRDYFLSKGYKPSEIYAVNFGLAGVKESGSGSLNYHSVQNISKIYRFIEAVRTYTQASKVDIIAHSLGVTTTRRAVKGGNYCDLFSCANLGPSLNAYIDTFVGIAGGNRGLNSCGIWPLNMWVPTCGPHGLSIGNPFLTELNGGYSSFMGYTGSNWKVGAFTYSILSYVDELTCAPLMPTTCHIWTVHTSKIKGEDGSKAYYTYPYGHLGIKNLTTDVQYNMVVNHTY